MDINKFLNSYLIAIDKKTGEKWIVYSIYYTGYPNPKINHVSVLSNDRSGYETKFISEIILQIK